MGRRPGPLTDEQVERDNERRIDVLEGGVPAITRFMLANASLSANGTLSVDEGVAANTTLEINMVAAENLIAVFVVELDPPRTITDLTDAATVVPVVDAFGITLPEDTTGKTVFTYYTQ